MQRARRLHASPPCRGFRCRAGEGIKARRPLRVTRRPDRRQRRRFFRKIGSTAAVNLYTPAGTFTDQPFARRKRVAQAQPACSMPAIPGSAANVTRR